MKLKIIPILCAAVLLTTTTAHAGTITETDLVDNSKDVNVKVTAEVGSTFTVSLPSSIELTQGGYSGTVGVKGDITSGNNVFVVPSSKITMHDVTARPEGVLEYEGYTHKDPVVGTVSQLETAWDYNILSSGASSGNFTYDSATQYYNTSLNVTTPKLSAGDWEGALTYNISLASHLSLAGLYDAGDNLLATWEDSGIDVSTNYRLDNFKTSETSGYYVLKNEYPTATKVVIPDSVTSIGDYALKDCVNLTSVTIPNSVTSIGDSGMGRCANLTSITIPDSVTSIGASAFSACTSLTSVTIPNSVTNIGDDAFHNCSGLTSVTISDSVTSIGSQVFHSCSSLTSVTIPNSVMSIGYYAFYSCSGLTSVTISDSVTSIGDGAFCDCSGLTSVTIPNSVTSIGEQAFQNVPHIYYNGSASGSPWGALAING